MEDHRGQKHLDRVDCAADGYCDHCSRLDEVKMQREPRLTTESFPAK